MYWPRSQIAAWMLLSLPLTLFAQETPPLLVIDQSVRGVIDDGDRAVETDTLRSGGYEGTPTVGRAYAFEVDAPGEYTLELRSYLFDAYLVLRDGEGQLLAEDDDGVGIGTHARIAFELETGCEYRVEACALHGERGPFELSLKRGDSGAREAADPAQALLEDQLKRVEIFSEHHGPRSTELADEITKLGVLYYQANALLEAIDCMRAALSIREEMLGPAHAWTREGLHNLGSLLEMAGREEEAREVLERLVSSIEATPDPDLLELASALGPLARVYAVQLELELARSTAERMLLLREQELGPDHPATAIAMDRLADILRELGDLAGARKLYERMLRIAEHSEGEDSRTAITTFANLAQLAEREGDLQEARDLYEELLVRIEHSSTVGAATQAVIRSNRALLLESSGEFQAACAQLERAVAICDEAYGINHRDTAVILSNLGVLRWKMGDREGARPCLERSLRIAESFYGKDHPEYARSLATLAETLDEAGALQEARKMKERALAIMERALGPDHPEVARSRRKLALTLVQLDELSEARKLLEQARTTHESTLGPEHTETAETLRSLAVVMVEQGELEQGGDLLARVLEFRERALGPDHLEMAGTAYSLGEVKRRLGDLSESQALFERSLAIREKLLGPRHPEVAKSLYAVAAVVRLTEGPAIALPLLERALSIREELLGPNDPATAEVLGKMSSLLQDVGDHPAARKLRERALAITEQTYGAESPQVSEHLFFLGILLSDAGNQADARVLFERCLAIAEGLENGDLKQAGYLRSLGVVLFREGDMEGGEALVRRALALRETDTVARPAVLADMLHVLAAIRAARGDLVEARGLLERAIVSFESIEGPGAWSTTNSTSLLVRVLADLGEVDRAWPMGVRSLRERRARLRRNLAGMTEGEGLLYLAEAVSDLEHLIDVASRSDGLEAGSATYGELIEWKGLVGRQLVAGRERILADMDPARLELVGRLREVQATLARLALEGRTPGEQDQSRQFSLTALRERRARMERELLRLEAGDVRVEPVGFERLAATVPEGAALVDFFVHDSIVPARFENGELVEVSRVGARHLSVWITRASAPAPVHLDLGPVEELEARVGAFLEGMLAHRGIASADGEGAAVSAANDALLELLWNPLAVHLEGAETIFVSPDGVMGTVPLEVLEAGDGRLLIEDFSFVYVSDAVSLVRRLESTRSVDALDSLLAVGGVDYRRREDMPVDGSLVDATLPNSPNETTPGTATLRGSLAAYWGRLPATAYEAQVVSDMHEDAYLENGRRLLLQGAAATETRLKTELSRFAVLHVATHGFFQPEGLLSAWDGASSRSVDRGDAWFESEGERLVGMQPGLLSGLVLAGVNRPLAEHESGDDGYLTAEELTWLDLSAVELVVLSACETGLGRAASGEGLMGLRRAFRMAGADTVISSLWSVKDESTSELMQEFYANLFFADMGRHRALRSAQLAMLARNRRQHGEPLPSTWGAFVLSGEWR